MSAIIFVLRIRRGCGFLAAPVCSSWIWLNRFTSGRSAADPLGHWYRPYVREANTQVVRVVILCLIAAALGLSFIVEQPEGSLLEQHPRWQHLCRMTQVFRHTIRMWDYGAQSEKPTWIYSNFAEVAHIDMFKSGRLSRKRKHLEITHHFVDKTGVHRSRGGKDLKATQTYTEGFANAVFKWQKCMRDNIAACENELMAASAGVSLEPLSDLPLQAAWADAEADGVLRLARSLHVR
jgi:hypothetical protein